MYYNKYCPCTCAALHFNGGISAYTEKLEVKISPQNTETFEVVCLYRVRPKSCTIHTISVAVGGACRITDPTTVRPYDVLLKNTNLTGRFDGD